MSKKTKPQIFRMGNNCMIVDNGVTKIITDRKLLIKSNEEILKEVFNGRRCDEDE